MPIRAAFLLIGWLNLLPALCIARTGDVHQLTTNVREAVGLDGRRALVLDTKDQFKVIDLRTRRLSRWACEFRLEDYGWQEVSAPFFLLASPDGRTVCFEQRFRDPKDNSYSGMIICNSSGRNGKLAALRCDFESTDYRREACFSRDGRYLLDWSLVDFPITDPHASALTAALRQADPESDFYCLSNFGRADAYDLQTRRTVSFGDFSFTADYFEFSPWGEFWFGDFNEHQRFVTVKNGRYVTAGNLYHAPRDFFWVAPHLMLSSGSDGPAEVARADGKLWPAPRGDWQVYLYLPDRRSVFSRDGGRTLDVGSINWQTGVITKRLRLTQVEQLLGGTPYDPSWYARYRWTALPHGAGALLRSEAGKLWLAEL